MITKETSTKENRKTTKPSNTLNSLPHMAAGRKEENLKQTQLVEGEGEK
jgi:hypothetical protein